MKRISKYILFLLIAVFVVGTFVFLFNNSKPKAVLYSELTTECKDIARTTVITGKIVPRNEVNIKPQINGIIAELCKEAGQLVQKDEVMTVHISPLQQVPSTLQPTSWPRSLQRTPSCI